MQKFIISLVIYGCMFSVPALSAQSIWLEQSPGTSLAVEYLKPYFVDSNSSFATSVLFFSGRFPLSTVVTVVVDMPFGHHGYKDNFGLAGFQSSTTMGNPFFGLEIRNQTSAIFSEFGFRLPLSNDEFSEGNRIGNISDPDRFGAFAQFDLMALARLNYHRQFDSHFLIQIRLGLMAGVKFNGPGDSGTFDHSLQLGYQVERLSLLVGFTGHHLLKARIFWRGEHAYQLGLAASRGFGAVRPGVYLSLPVNDFLNDDIHFVLGLNLTARLK